MTTETAVLRLESIIHDPRLETEEEVRSALQTALSAVPEIVEAFEDAFRPAFYGDPDSTMTGAFEDAASSIGAITTDERYVCAAALFVMVDDRDLEPGIASLLGIGYDDDDESDEGAPRPTPPWMQRRGRKLAL